MTDSSPCFAHKLVDGHVIDPQTATDVSRFRKAQRKQLYAMRKAVPLDTRREQSFNIGEMLDKCLAEVTGMSIAVYWPIRGEPDLRNWMEKCHENGAVISLPVVTARDNPVEFHKWEPGCDMKLGIWNIPVPANEKSLCPDVVIVPLLGVDNNRYRLGNGGGYYDRTLAALPDTTKAIGVGQEFARMETIFPMPWDIPMQKVLLSDGTVY